MVNKALAIKSQTLASPETFNENLMIHEEDEEELEEVKGNNLEEAFDPFAEIEGQESLEEKQ